MTTDAGKPIVLITGVSGLIGQNVARQLKDDYHVVGLDIQGPDKQSQNFYECDLTDIHKLKNTFEQIKRDLGPNVASVVHLAAYYDFSGEPSPMYEELTVQGSRRLLECLQDFNVEQFIFSSSLLVMEPCETGEQLTEDSPIQAEWAYPESKVRAEQVIREHHGNIPVVILRLAGVYDEEGHSLPVCQQISRIYEKSLESYFFPGNQDHGQAFVHIEDVARCVERAIQHRGQLGAYEVFLIAEPDVMTYGELQDRIGEELHGMEWPTIRIPKVLAKAGAWAKSAIGSSDEFIKPWMVDLADAHYPVDMSHAAAKLNWHPGHRLRNTLHLMLERLKRNPKKWYQTNKLNYPGDA